MYKHESQVKRCGGLRSSRETSSLESENPLGSSPPNLQALTSRVERTAVKAARVTNEIRTPDPN